MRLQTRFHLGFTHRRSWHLNNLSNHCGRFTIVTLGRSVKRIGLRVRTVVYGSAARLPCEVRVPRALSCRSLALPWPDFFRTQSIFFCRLVTLARRFPFNHHHTVPKTSLLSLLPLAVAAVFERTSRTYITVMGELPQLGQLPCCRPNSAGHHQS